jgi:hypothetical protein
LDVTLLHSPDVLLAQALQAKASEDGERMLHWPADVEALPAVVLPGGQGMQTVPPSE